MPLRKVVSCEFFHRTFSSKKLWILPFPVLVCSFPAIGNCWALIVHLYRRWSATLSSSTISTGGSTLSVFRKLLTLRFVSIIRVLTLVFALPWQHQNLVVAFQVSVSECRSVVKTTFGAISDQTDWLARADRPMIGGRETNLSLRRTIKQAVVQSLWSLGNWGRKWGVNRQQKSGNDVIKLSVYKSGRCRQSVHSWCGTCTVLAMVRLWLLEEST